MSYGEKKTSELKPISMQTSSGRSQIEEWLLDTMGCSLSDLCRHFNYPSENVKIMMLKDATPDEVKQSIAVIRGDAELRALYTGFNKESVRRLQGEDNNGKKSRSLTDYFKQLIIGWIFEDLFYEWLRAAGVDIKKCGHDHDRKIKSNGINCEPDFIITVGDNARKVEYTTDFVHYALDPAKKYVEKRNEVLPRLRQNGGIWLVNDVIAGKYVLIDFAAENIVLHKRYHDIWKKNVYTYRLDENHKMMRDTKLLIPEIITLCGSAVRKDLNTSFKIIEDNSQPTKDESETKKGVEQKKVVEKKENPKVVKTAPPPAPIASNEEENEVVSEVEDNGEGEAEQGIDYGDSDFV